MKLRTKLTLITTLIVIVSINISTILIANFAKQNITQTVVETGISNFETFYNSFLIKERQNELDKHSASTQSYLRYMFYEIPGHGEYILQQNDNVISNNTGIDGPKVLNAVNSTKVDVPGLETPLHHASYQINKEHYFTASTDILIGGENYTLCLVHNVTDTMDSISRLTAECAIAGAAIIILAATLVLLLTKRSLKPIEALELGAMQIAEGSYEKRIAVEGHDEIAALAERFNRMAEAISGKIGELNERAERQRMFISGLSHEMKTPVTSIMARAETLLLRDISDIDRKHSLERIYDQCAWLERFSGKLMSFTMLESSVEKKPESVVELFYLVRETVSASLKEKGISLISDCRINTLPMDMDLMRSALVNLIENSRRASNAVSVIELLAYDNLIEVKDHGSGIPQADVARVTKPFYMVDKSRSKKNGGIGLGLALVKRIVETHGITMEISSKINTGTSVKLIWDNIDN